MSGRPSALPTDLCHETARRGALPSFSTMKSAARDTCASQVFDRWTDITTSGNEGKPDCPSMILRLAGMTEASITETADPPRRAFSIKPMLRVEYATRHRRSIRCNTSKAISLHTQPEGNNTSERG